MSVRQPFFLTAAALAICLVVVTTSVSAQAQAPSHPDFTAPVQSAATMGTLQAGSGSAATITPGYPVPTPPPTPPLEQPSAPAQAAPTLPGQATDLANQLPLNLQTLPGGLPTQAVPGASSQLPTGMPTLPGNGAFAPPAKKQEEAKSSEIVTFLSTQQKEPELRAVLRTSMGDITIRLNKKLAPKTVAHFVALSRGEKEFIDSKTSKKVKRPFYNGLTFHRVIKNLLVQTGCPFGNGRGGPGDIALIDDEIDPAHGMKFDKPGMVAMAPMRDSGGTNFQKNSNGSQFFITLAPQPDWNDQFTIFGRVEEGMDVVKKISESKVGPTERPIKRVYLLAVDIIEGAAPEPTPAPVAPQATTNEAPPVEAQAGEAPVEAAAPPPSDLPAVPDVLSPPPAAETK